MSPDKKRALKRNIEGYAFLSPFIILVTALYILPAVLTIIMAFTNLNSAFIWKYAGWTNFIKILRDPNTGTIVQNTIVYILVTIAITIVLQLFFATLTTYFIRNEKIGNFFKSMLMIPMITPTVVYSVLWLWLLDSSENGVLNQWYMSVTGNNPINWIATYPFEIVIFVQILTSIAYGTTIYASAIKSIPENQFKAARVDGAGEWEIFKHIILSNLKPHVLFIALWETLGLLTNYIAILLITNGGPGVKTEVWALSAYHKAFDNLQYGYGAAISLVLIVVVAVFMLVISLIARRMNKKKEVLANG